MSRLTKICALVVLILTVGSAQADMTIFVSGDSNITNPLTGSFGQPIDTGNQQFFSNVLGTGTSVALLNNLATGSVGNSVTDIDTYYNSLSGVSSSRFFGTVTSAQLSGVDLFVVVLPDGTFTAAEVAVMTSFLYGGGDIFFLGENSNFPGQNARINSALTGLGSSLGIVNDMFDSGFHVATGSQIASDPYTTGVSTFTYAAPSQVPLVAGGTTLFYGTGGQAFVAYEVVPVPGALLLGMLGLSLAGVKLRKHA